MERKNKSNYLLVISISMLFWIKSTNSWKMDNRDLMLHQSKQYSCLLNSMCQCTNLPNDTQLIEINCNQVSLYKFPEFLHGSVRHIEISRTYLQSVDDETFQGLRLESLKLVDNKLSEFSEKSFSSMVHSLLSLDISGNLLQYLPLKSLRNIHTLSRIIAQRNNIYDLDGNWGNLADSLRSLHLSSNSIGDLISLNYDERKSNHTSTISTLSSIKPFSKLRKLVWLDISNNRVAHINTNLLPKSIMTIDVSRNLLTTIPITLFEHLKDIKILLFKDNLIKSLVNLNELPLITNNKLLHLEKIDLSLNEIENLTSNIFSELVKVKALSFDKNFIKFIPNNVFSNTGIVHLVLAFNYIEALQLYAFHGLEDSLEYLDLERNQLRRIPDALSILNKLRYLYFTSNLINRIDSDNYVLPTTLKVLSLSGNTFVQIPSEGLANCTELTYLNMGYNKIADIQENEFLGWGSQLQTLLLRNNKITSLNFGVFNGLDSIKEISLSFNDIHYVHPNVFENISKTLKILELSFGIYRDDFPLEALSHLTELMWLGLDNNNLKVISENSLSSLNQLTYINFGFNRIKSLPRNTFLPETHRNLMEIDLSYNLIEKISSNTFDDLPGLQIIHLTSNSIGSIDKYGFHNLPLLMYLDLTHNKLKNISENSFVFLPNCLKLDFMFNELQYFSLKFFKHVTNSSSPMSLNISHNKINKFNGDINSYLYIYKLDASHNLLHESDQFDKLSYSLKFLFLANNNFSLLSNHAFGDLDNLEILDLSKNLISLIRRRSFQGLVNLQELNLGNNKIEQLQVEQFSNLKKLRILKLNGNRLKALPRDVFLNTRIEYLDLSSNFINLWPSSSLSDIGFTLRSIQFGNNQIEYIDSTMFVNIQFLLQLNLTNNKITLLPDITFSSLNNLTVLDLSFNPLISTNFKELFLNSPKLKILNLKSTGLYSVPQLNLEYLTELDLSVNNINDIYSINDLKFLKILRISQNKIVNLTNFGKHLPSTLRELDISRNPIRKITQHDFNQLKRLEILNLEEVRIASDIFVKLTNLKKLYVTGQPNLSEFIGKIAGLRFIHVTVNEDYIDDLLFAKLINNTKINEFIVTGSKLTKISNNAFDGLARNHELTIRLRKTLIDDVPAGIFYALKDVPRLTIDLSNNLLSTLSPDSFYPNSSSWDAVGTRSIVGGMDLSRNPLQCDCGLVWLGHWLRRWLRETSQANLISKEEMKAMIQKARQSTCHDQTTGKEYTILEIFPEDLLCHASALSSIGNSNSRFSIIYVCILFILFIYQHRIFTILL